MKDSPPRRSSTYCVFTAGAFLLLAYVVVRAPLWTSAMAGARVHVGTQSIALVSAAWSCSDRPHVCSTTIGGGRLEAKVGALGDDPMTCSAAYEGTPVACALRLWYAPRLKPVLEIGSLPGVTYSAALLERPWRVLDLGLLGEEGMLHFKAGLPAALILAQRASARVRGRGFGLAAQAGLAGLAFTLLGGVWFMACVILGYID